MIRVIKRYESRKLYDTEESRYISLDDIAQWVREGQEVRVVDNATSADVSSQVLTQIIHDEGKKGTSFLPTDLLHELVRAGERALSNGVEQVQGRVDRLVQKSFDRIGPVRRAREEMSHLRERLGELEKTLSSLEAGQLEAEDVDPASEPKAAAKTTARKTTARKTTAKKTPAKPSPARKTAAKSSRKTTRKPASTRARKSGSAAKDE